MNAIETHALVKEFAGKRAVDSLDLTIQKGELFGLLGPNGAGKTTTISMLATLLPPTSGSALVNGIPLTRKDAVRKAIGIVFQDPSLDIELTGRENLDFHGRMYSMPASERRNKIPEVLALVQLEDKADQLVKTYSGGMKRRLEIARGLLHTPSILFLDEPSLGLDPQTRRHLWDYIRTLKKGGITVILTTHYMEEADALCDRIAIIDRGKIVALDTPENLKKVIGGDVLTFETEKVEQLSVLLKKQKGVKKVTTDTRSVSLTVAHGDKMLPALFALAQKQKISIASVQVKKPTLEDVFLHFTGHSIRDEKADGKEMLRHAGWMARR